MKTLLLKVAFAGGLMLAAGAAAHDGHSGAGGVSGADRGEMHGHGGVPMMDGGSGMGGARPNEQWRPGGPWR